MEEDQHFDLNYQCQSPVKNNNFENAINLLSSN